MNHNKLILVPFIQFCLCAYSQNSNQFEGLGWENLKNKNYVIAQEYFSKCTFQSDDNFECLYGLAYSNYKLKNYIVADSICNYMLLIDKTVREYKYIKTNGHWLKGLIQIQLSYNKKAIDELKKAIEYQNNPDILNALGLVYLKDNRLKKGIKYFKKAIQMDSLNAYAFNNLASAYLMLEKIDLAKLNLKYSENILPANPYLYKNKAKVAAYEGRYEEACKFIQTSKELGYKKFEFEDNSDDLESLIKKYCSTR